MELVINISEENLEKIKHARQGIFIDLYGIMETAINNGTPLPKGHGRLVDISKIDEDRIESDNPVIYLTMNGQCTEAISLDYLNSLPTIIEPDKEGIK